MPITIVQSKKGGGLTQAFTNNTASGNLIVAVATIVDTTTTEGTATIADTQGNSYTQVTTVSKAGAGNAFGVWIWFATASAGADTITVTYSQTGATVGVIIFELSGATGVGVVSATGTGSGAPVTATSTASLAFTDTNSFLVAGLSIGEGTTPTSAAGTGFTLDQVDVNNVMERAIGGITSPTTFPLTQSGGSGTNNWAEAGAVFPTAPISAVFRESGAKRQYRREGRMR